ARVRLRTIHRRPYRLPEIQEGLTDADGAAAAVGTSHAAGATRLIRDRYEVLATAGHGGQGEVLHALDRVHDRHVALKVRLIGSEAERAAMLSEARLLLGVRPHPNLPLVREDFIEGDRYYVAMDWVDGRDLRQVLQLEGMPGLTF